MKLSPLLIIKPVALHWVPIVSAVVSAAVDHRGTLARLAVVEFVDFGAGENLALVLRAERPGNAVARAHIFKILKARVGGLLRLDGATKGHGGVVGELLSLGAGAPSLLGQLLDHLATVQPAEDVASHRVRQLLLMVYRQAVNVGRYTRPGRAFGWPRALESFDHLLIDRRAATYSLEIVVDIPDGLIEPVRKIIPDKLGRKRFTVQDLVANLRHRRHVVGVHALERRGHLI